MKAIYLCAAVCATLAAAPASASHIFFTDVRIDGVALDSTVGLTNPVFNIGQGGTLTFSLSGTGDGGDTIDASFSGVPGMTPTSVSFPFAGDNVNFSQLLTFNTLGSFQGSVLVDIPSSSPDYIDPSGGAFDDGKSFNFRVNVNAINSAVPEPGTWAMMLLGFGGMGVAMRRTRRRTSLHTQIA